MYWMCEIIYADMFGSTTPETTNDVYEFPKGSVVAGKDNVITIIQVSGSSLVHRRK